MVAEEVAASVDGDGSDIQEGGPPSTDDEDEASDGISFSFSGGSMARRDGSFRKRTEEKIGRAKAISSSLTSHLVTPAMHARRLEEVPAPALPMGARTSTMEPRRMVAELPPRRPREGNGDSFRRRATTDSQRKESLSSLAALATTGTTCRTPAASQNHVSIS